MTLPDLDVLVLDVNETLSDLEPLRGRFEQAGLPAEALETWFAATLRDGFAVTAAGGYVPFKTVAAAALRTLLASRGVETADTVDSVLSGLADLPAHADVGPGLRRLRENGIRLATLTNGSTAIAEKVLAAADALQLVEQRLSVETPKRWKPHPDAYRYAAEALGVDPTRLGLVAVHPWDIDGAGRAGMAGIWVNRKNTPYPDFFVPPTVEVPDLQALADLLAGGSS